MADAARVAQVLENLLNNASKYTAEGGAIAVQVREAPAHVEIRVRAPEVEKMVDRVATARQPLHLEGLAEHSLPGGVLPFDAAL